MTITYYIVYAGNGATTQGMKSRNCLTSLENAQATFEEWVKAGYSWVYINRTIPGTPDQIIKRYPKVSKYDKSK